MARLLAGYMEDVVVNSDGIPAGDFCEFYDGNSIVASTCRHLRHGLSMCLKHKVGLKTKFHLYNGFEKLLYKKCADCAAVEILPAPEATEKVCTKCDVLQPLENYHRDRKRKDGYSPICRECYSAYYRARRQRNK